MSSYHEYDASAEYLHLLMRPAWEQLQPRLVAALEGVDPHGGTLLELGPGSGIGTGILLDTVPDAPVLAAEPSSALRAVLLGRLSDRGDAHRVTVYPGGATAVPLPARLAGVVGLHMVGHLRPHERRALWADLAPRLSPGAPVVLNTQPPDTAVRVPVSAPYAVTSGELAYEGRGGAEPTGPESVRWSMSYRTLHGDVVLGEATAQYDWWTVSAATLADELRTAGLEVATPYDDLVVARAGGSTTRRAP